MMQPGADKAAVLLLGLAAAGWYAAGRAAADAVAGRCRSAGRRAAGFAVPVLCCVIAAIAAGRPEIAVGVLFATSVASLTLVLGVSVIVSPHAAILNGRRSWVFVLPVALIALLIGFAGQIRAMHAMFLVLEGLALLLLWNDPGQSDPAIEQEASPARPTIGAMIGRSTELLVAVIAAAVAGWIGVTAAHGIAKSLELPSAGLISALMVAPALILPMLGTCATLSAAGRLDDAVGSVVGFVLINLCAILPLAATLWITRGDWQPQTQRWVQSSLGVEPPLSRTPAPVAATTHSATTDSATRTHTLDFEDPSGLPYPMAVWRVDTVILIACGLLLLPITLGRWTLDRAEGLALIITYALYMVLTTIASR